MQNDARLDPTGTPSRDQPEGKELAVRARRAPRNPGPAGPALLLTCCVAAASLPPMLSLLPALSPAQASHWLADPHPSAQKRPRLPTGHPLSRT